MRSVVVSLALFSTLTGLLVACGGSLGSSSINASDGGAANEDGAAAKGDGGTSVPLVDAGSIKTVDGSSVDAGKCTATEGASCAVDGARCSPSLCTDPCQFCNMYECIYGKWQVIEAAPLPPDQCADHFDCGGTTCNKGSYCVARHAGVQLSDGGIPPTTYVCLPLDPNCTGGCSCAMQAAIKMSSCDPKTCTSPDGGPVVDCYGF